MSEWLRDPGFVGTHATMGADISQLMATLFTGLFIVGWIQAKKRKAERSSLVDAGRHDRHAGIFYELLFVSPARRVGL